MKTWLLAILIIFGGFFAMMRMKADVTALDRERYQLVREQHDMQERIRILNADLAMLKNPARLQTIAAQSGFEQLTSKRIIPLSPPVVVSATLPTQ